MRGVLRHHVIKPPCVASIFHVIKHTTEIFKKSDDGKLTVLPKVGEP